MKRICVIAAALALVLSAGACGGGKPQAEPDPDMFFNALEAGRYYMKAAPLIPDTGASIEIAVDGEKLYYAQSYDDNELSSHVLLNGKMYTYSGSGGVGQSRDCSADERQSLFNNYAVSKLLAFRAHHTGGGDEPLEFAVSPDSTEYHYEEYYATVGELRDTWLFSSQTPDDAKLYLRVYFSGGELYAYGLKSESSSGWDQAFRIFEFSPELPDGFTFEPPPDYEWERR